MTITVDVPDNAQVVVKNGQDLDFKTPLLKIKFDKDFVVPLTHILQIPANKIFMSLKKMIGDNIVKGETLAEKKGLFNGKQYKSEVNGRIKEIDHNQGNVTITVSSGAEATRLSPVKGQVSSTKRGKIEIELPEGKNFELKEANSDFGGEIAFIDNETSSSLSEKTIGEKAVFIEKIASYELAKLEALTVWGLVTLYQVQNTSLPYARIKNEPDWKKIRESKLPYCFCDKKNSIIYLYK